jgi:2,4-dienoyl-CoA reductase-like NADH-dependent reductase (Old Yellow Enzyme family)
MKSHLFSEYKLGPVMLENRIVVSPMCQYMAEDGSANDWHLMHYGNMSIGAGGLIMFEATHVSSVGRITHKCLGLYSDQNEQALKRVVDFCRTHGRAKLGIQLAHSGRKGSAKTPMEGMSSLGKDDSPWETLAPSALPFADGWRTPKAMQKEDLERVKQEFLSAAIRAVRLGFDVIELHAAHGYLLNQFLSPLSNHRTDEYGGAAENRMRFPLEILDALKQTIPASVALGARISGTDWVDGGISEDDMVEFTAALEARGCDFVDVTSGQLDPRQQIPFAPGFNLPFSKKVKSSAKIAAMGVGMITNPLQAEDAIATGSADLIAIARAAMDDPRWAWHAARDLDAPIEYAKNYQRCHPSVWQR